MDKDKVMGYLPGDGVPRKTALNTLESRALVDQIVLLMEERCHPDEFGKAAAGEILLQATVRLIGWKAAQGLLVRQ